jgi:DNA-binding NarL/FixJ family response regulator
LGVLAIIQARQNKQPQADACLAELETLITTLPSGSMPVGQALSYMASAALLLDERERLSRLYPQLSVFRGRVLDHLVDRLLGEMETLQGNFAAAQVSLAAAEAVARREDLQWELAHVRIAQANLELAQSGRGRAAQAYELLSEAQSIFRRFGNEVEVRRLQMRLRQLPSPPQTRPQTSFPAGLSRREVEVLRLVAAGKSNREIAKALHLSEYTVAHHLTSIFNKTGVDNRAAATAFAIRHDLG